MCSEWRGQGLLSGAWRSAARPGSRVPSPLEPQPSARPTPADSRLTSLIDERRPSCSFKLVSDLFCVFTPKLALSTSTHAPPKPFTKQSSASPVTCRPDHRARRSHPQRRSMFISFAGPFRAMPKRSLASLPASPSRPKKKAKVEATGQSRLDAFFGGSSRRTLDPAGPSSAVQSSSTSTPPLSGTRGKVEEPKPPQSDEELAWAIAAADGLDIETLRRLEGRKSGAHLSPAASPVPGPPSRLEVIDVDALSEDDSVHPRLSNKVTSQHASNAAASTASGSTGSSAHTRDPSHNSATNHTTKPPQLRGNTPQSRISAATIGNASPLALPTYEPLNVDPSAYDPAAAAATWPPDAPVPYSFLSFALATLSATRSRIAKLDTLTNALRTICRQHPESLLPALYLLSNSLAPPYSPVELGLGPSIISKAIQHVSGLSGAALKRLYNATGDPGKSPSRLAVSRQRPRRPPRSADNKLCGRRRGCRV